MTETDLQRDILAYLKARGITAWRANSGYVKKNVKLSPEGTPDIIGYLLDGRFLGIEVKLPGKPLRPSQAAWLKSAESSGCAVAVVHSVEECNKAIELFYREIDWF